MARICMFSGRKTQSGRTRSHSMRQGLRTFKVNLLKKRVHLGDGVYATVKISAKDYKKNKGLVGF